MQYEFTEEDRLKILKLVNGNEQGVVDDDCIGRFFALYGAVCRATVSIARSRSREMTRLKTRLERYSAHEEDLCLKGEFQGRGLDSVVVARALLYCIQQAYFHSPSYYISMQKLQILLYDVYANYLARYRMRMTIEGPKSSGYEDKRTGKTVCLGPCFWRVKNALSDIMRKQEKMTAADYDTLANADPDAAGLCWGAAKKRATEEDASLFNWIKNSEPYRDADRDRNGGKFGKDYSDALIYKWKSDQIALRRERKAEPETAPKEQAVPNPVASES